MDNQAQLSWEARFGRLAAGSAIAAIVFEIASAALQIAANKDAPGRHDPFRHSQTLSQFHEHSGAVLVSSISHAIAVFFAAGALFYLFRATRHRRAELPKMVQWLLVVAPILVTIGAVANWSGLKDASDQYASRGGEAGAQAKLSKDERDRIATYCRKHARDVRQCRTIHERNEAVAKKLIQDKQGAVGVAGLYAGSIALAFIYVIISLNAMRAGLLSRFMGILGIIVGALIVLPLLPGVPIVEIFWLGALAVLFLGVSPGGRGPAWETGEAEPWPTPQARAGLPERAENDEPELEPEAEVEKEPERPHPVSKKRKRKRRR